MWRKSSRSNSQGNCVEVMSLIRIPKGWTQTLTFTSDSAEMNIQETDTNIGIRISVRITNNSLLGAIWKDGEFLGPALDLNFEQAIPFTPVEILYLVFNRYLEFYTEENDENLANIIGGLLYDLQIRPPVMGHLEESNKMKFEL